MSSDHDLSSISFFVSSTFVDLEQHRKSMIAAISAASGIIKAQEFFGSRPNTPLETCLAEIDQSDVVILMVAHRYGSVDEQSGKSFTQIEYEHARGTNKPVLAYIVDDNFPWLPAHISTASEAERLQKFKEMVRKDLTVDTFTTPDDLASKVLQDLKRELPSHGFRIGTEDEAQEHQGTLQLLKQYSAIPKLLVGRDVIINGILGDYFAATQEQCDALGLSMGASVRRTFTPTDKDIRTILLARDWDVYATGNAALDLVSLPADCRLYVRLKMKFGSYSHKEKSEELVDVPYNPFSTQYFFSPKRLIERYTYSTHYLSGFVFVDAHRTDSE